MEIMKRPSYKNVEELLDDPSFLRYCHGQSAEDNTYWNDRINEDSQLNELATLAKQTYWTVYLNQDENLEGELLQFKAKKNTISSVDSLPSRQIKTIRNRKIQWIASAAAVILIGLLFSLYFIQRTPDLMNLTTGIGEVREFTLPDGSVMYLNANSQVSLNAENFVNDRTIHLLHGEAFFEVDNNHKSVFTVLTARGMKVEDISTAFTVRSLEGLDHETVQVQDGLVRFISKDGKQTELIEEGAGIRFDHATQQLQNISADNISTSGWITGQYAVFDVSLLEFSKILSSVFDVEINFKSEDTKQKRISALFTRDQEVADIMQNIGTIYDLEIAIIGNLIKI
jgi:transmembrane sensor